MKLLKVLFLFFVICCLSVYFLFFTNYVVPWHRNDAIQATLEWGGLNRIPVEEDKI